MNKKILYNLLFITYSSISWADQSPYILYNDLLNCYNEQEDQNNTTKEKDAEDEDQTTQDRKGQNSKDSNGDSEDEGDSDSNSDTEHSGGSGRSGRKGS